MKLFHSLLLTAVTTAMAVIFSFCVEGAAIKASSNTVVKQQISFIHIPIIESSTPPPKVTKVNVELEHAWKNFYPWFNTRTAYKVSCAWALVENTWSVYDWSSCDRKVGDIKPYWVVFKTTPPWALYPGQPQCKLPRRIFWPNAAFFLQNLIDRFKPSDPSLPFYIEVWNEPNAHWSDMPPELSRLFGCVGEEGGELYGEFYTYLRDHTYGAELVLGAVSIANDPFLVEAIEETNDQVDAVSFHCYTQFINNKLEYRQCLDWFDLVSSLTEHPVFLSETAVHYRSGIISSDTKYSYENGQIDWFLKLLKLPTDSNWYTGFFNGYPVCTPEPCGSDLLSRDPITKIIFPRPVWFLYMDQ